MSSEYIDATVIIAVIAIATSLSAVIAWVFRRGRSEGQLEKSMQDNTRATHELNQTVAVLNDKLGTGFKEVHDRIDNHDVALAQHKITLSVHDRDIMRLQQGSR